MSAWLTCHQCRLFAWPLELFFSGSGFAAGWGACYLYRYYIQWNAARLRASIESLRRRAAIN